MARIPLAQRTLIRPFFVPFVPFVAISARPERAN
jgi:hypothetical protein